MSRDRIRDLSIVSLALETIQAAARGEFLLAVLYTECKPRKEGCLQMKAKS